MFNGSSRLTLFARDVDNTRTLPMFIDVRGNLRMRSGTQILTSFANIFPGLILILNLKMLLLPLSHNGVRDWPSSYGSFLPVFNLPFDNSMILGGKIYLRD